MTLTLALQLVAIAASCVAIYFNVRTILTYRKTRKHGRTKP